MTSQAAPSDELATRGGSALGSVGYPGKRADADGAPFKDWKRDDADGTPFKDWKRDNSDSNSIRFPGWKRQGQ